MNELIKIGNQEISMKEYKGKRVVTFKDIDLVHERPEGTARKRFSDNRKRFVSGVDFFRLSKEEAQLSEIRTDEISNNGITLITESGYLMLVKSFTDDLAWDVQRQLVNTYFDKKKGASAIDQLKLQSQAILEVNEKVENVQRELDEFKEDMPLLGVETEKITQAVKKRGVYLLGGKESNAYNDRSLCHKVYSDIHREVRRQFGVSTYKAIKRNQCEQVIAVIERHELPLVLQEQIEDTNAQINLRG